MVWRSSAFTGPRTTRESISFISSPSTEARVPASVRVTSLNFISDRVALLTLAFRGRVSGLPASLYIAANLLEMSSLPLEDFGISPKLM